MTDNKIKIVDGKIVTPDFPIIPFIEGDGTGPDIWRAAQRVFDAAVQKIYGDEKKVQWKEVLAGEKAYNETGNWLPNETLETINKYLIAIKGPLTTPIGGGFRSLNVALRQELDLYVCLRPVRYFNGVPSPVKHPEKTDMVIFRENTEDIYAGIEFAEGKEATKTLIDTLQNQYGVDSIRFPKTSGIAIKPISKEGTERLVRAAIEFALKEKRKSITIVHKGNIMKYTEGAFKNWGYDLAEREFPEKVFTWQQYEKIKEEKGEEAANSAQEKALKDGRLLIKDCIADILLQQILTRPEEFDVIATMNLNGDYISDALAAQVGGIGIAPGANINYVTGKAIFEATHGTAPKYANLDKVNPSSVILSGVMLFNHIGWDDVADAITDSLEKTIHDKTVTYDFARLMDGATEVSCSGFADALINNL